MSIKFRVLGGGGYFGFFFGVGEGSADLIFMGAGIFLKIKTSGKNLQRRLLKGSFDKRVRIDLPVPLSVPTPPRTLPISLAIGTHTPL